MAAGYSSRKKTASGKGIVGNAIIGRPTGLPFSLSHIVQRFLSIEASGTDGSRLCRFMKCDSRHNQK